MFHFKRAQQAVLAVLLVLTLAGAQTAQNSPWHDHGGQHSVDCALCHLQAYDADLAPAPLALASRFPSHITPERPRARHAAHSPSPYQGRAPPTLS